MRATPGHGAPFVDRRGFVRRAFALALLPGALASLAGCSRQQLGETAGFAWEGKTPARSLELAYATQFAVDFYDGGYAVITVADGNVYLLVETGAQEPADVPAGVAVLRQPLDCIYLVATQAMDLFRALDGVGNVRLSGLAADGWYIDEARQAMESGAMLYAGKYAAPDYELIVDQGCDLAIENTMVYHNPEVKEQLEKFGVPVFVERSSYEGHPLARMEWLKLYGVLLGKENGAVRLFDEQIERLTSIIDQPSTGKTVAFFYITSGGAVNVRKTGDYLAKAIELAGGAYVPEDAVGESGSALSTMNMQMESFYAAAKDADCLIYNATIDGELTAIDQLLARSGVLKDFKAVQSGDVWCTGKNLFQETLGLGDLIVDIHRVLTDDDPSPDDLVYLHRLV